MTTPEALVEADRQIRDGAQALGDALKAVKTFVPPPIARAVVAKENLYDRIEAEFGLLTAGEVGRLLGSRSQAPRNQASQTRRGGRLLAISRGHQVLYPGFQFNTDGQPLPVIAELRTLAERSGWSEPGIVQWLMSPTTYLPGGGAGEDSGRPVDLLISDPAKVLDVAERAWTVEW